MAFFPGLRAKAPRDAALSRFQRESGLHFKNQQLLNLALTHRSCGNDDAAKGRNNERLEFLGDAVLGLVAASFLYERLGDKAEGDLARIKSHIVSEDTLSDLARGLGLDRYILLGKGEEQSGGRGKKAILADALEAVFGACYADQGFEAARRFILRLLEPEVTKVLQNRHHKDYKTLLQEYAQKYRWSHPEYRLVRREGPDHDRTFWISCQTGGRAYEARQGKNKKEAEQAAAQCAYESIMAEGGIDAARLVQLENS